MVRRLGVLFQGSPIVARPGAMQVEGVMKTRVAAALPPDLLRLSDAGDAKPAWITLLTTEHYNLQMQRMATISDANGRASVFLGAVSAGLIALGFQGVGHGQSAATMVFAVLVLSSLLFLGLVTFVRCLEVALDDWEFVTRIAHVRAAYIQLVPELEAMLSASWGDEALNVMLRGRWRPFQKMLSVAGSVAVISSVLFGADIGVLIYGCGTSLSVAIAGGAVGGLVLIAALGYYQWARWCEASPKPNRSITPAVLAAQQATAARSPRSVNEPSSTAGPLSDHQG
jgi:hypothetical protein